MEQIFTYKHIRNSMHFLYYADKWFSICSIFLFSIFRCSMERFHSIEEKEAPFLWHPFTGFFFKLSFHIFEKIFRNLFFNKLSTARPLNEVQQVAFLCSVNPIYKSSKNAIKISAHFWMVGFFLHHLHSTQTSFAGKDGKFFRYNNPILSCGKQWFNLDFPCQQK